MKLRILAILMLAMLGLAYAHDVLADEPVTLYVHTEKDLLNGRRDPDPHSPVEAGFDRGEAVTAYRLSGGWVKLKGGEPGTVWSRGEYLASYPLGEEAPLYTVVSTGRVRVRNVPDGASLVRYVRNGEAVAVRFILAGWAFLGDGYMMAEYLTAAE